MNEDTMSKKMTDEQRQVIYDGALYAFLQSMREDYAVAWGSWCAGEKDVPFCDAINVIRDALKEGRAIVRSGKKVNKKMQELRKRYDQ